MINENEKIKSSKKPIIVYATIALVGAAALAAVFSRLQAEDKTPVLTEPIVNVETVAAVVENEEAVEETTNETPAVIDSAAADFKIAIFDNQKLQWPTSGHSITQKYNPPEHTGLDIDGEFDSPVYAAEAGVVEFVGENEGYGNTYIINHGNGLKTLYAHLSKMFAKVGQQVARGEVLGLIGDTGWATGTHLHFEVMVNEEKQNPEEYIK
jgi:murein DD-endopeptidase MepM/ murein hydrolase activator NlpD